MEGLGGEVLQARFRIKLSGLRGKSFILGYRIWNGVLLA